jgi:hypothetical protein
MLLAGRQNRIDVELAPARSGDAAGLRPNRNENELMPTPSGALARSLGHLRMLRKRMWRDYAARTRARDGFVA